MPNSIFSYENLNKTLIRERQKMIQDDETCYCAKLGDGIIAPKGFIILAYTGEPSSTAKTAEGSIAQKYRLKFHISLPEWDRTNYAKGWDIVKDILIENKIEFSKIAHEEIRMSQGSDNSQQGKDVTICAYYHPEKDGNFWFNIAQRITEELTRNSVCPGYATLETGDRADTRLNGSNYITYRYEKALPATVSDFCTKANIIVANQALPKQSMESTDTVSNELAVLSSTTMQPK
jgi:hypothetical protein